jgi:hypothetical protein
LSNVIRRLVGHVEAMAKKRNTYWGFFRNPDGKGPLGMRRRWWENNIKMDLTELRCGDVAYINLD